MSDKNHVFIYHLMYKKKQIHECQRDKRYHVSIKNILSNTPTCYDDALGNLGSNFFP